MRWYVSIDGRVHGPFEEQQVVDLVRSGRPDVQLRGEAGGPWLPVQQSPFAGFAPPASFVAPASAPTVIAPTRASPPMSTEQKAAIALFSLGSLVALVLCLIHGMFGVLLGLSLIVWAIIAELKRRRSLLAFVFARPASLLMSGGLVAMGLAFSTCGAVVLVGSQAVEAERRQAAESARRADEEKTRKRAALEQELPSKLKSWRGTLERAQATADRGNPSDAHRQAEGVRKEIEDSRLALGDPEPPELAAAAKDAKQRAERLKAHADLLEGVAAIDTNIAKGKEHQKNREWLEADKAFDAALELVSLMEKAPAPARAYLPKDFDPAKKRRETERHKMSIAGPVAREKKRLEQEAEKRKQAEAYAALCGTAPTISAWDGEVVGLESALKETAHDPDSIDVEHCTTPVLTGKICWVFSCDVRGKNMFGAKILLRKKFSYSTALGFQELED